MLYCCAWAGVAISHRPAASTPATTNARILRIIAEPSWITGQPPLLHSLPRVYPTLARRAATGKPCSHRKSLAALRARRSGKLARSRPLEEPGMDPLDVYDNPLVTRYASPEMSRLWGPRRKFSTWRRLWVVLAEA